MNLTAFLNVGKLAKAATATAKLAADIGPRVVSVLLELVKLESEISAQGNGEKKLKLLLEWAARQFMTDSQIDLVEEFAAAMVAILNVLKVFRK